MRAVGIDLGTSNSAVAVLDDDGRARILTTEEGSTTLPSIVAFDDGGKVLVGEAALARAASHPHDALFGAKRLLGRRADEPEVRKLGRLLPYELVPAPNGDAWMRAADRSISPEQVSAFVLRELKTMAERFLDEPVEDAVITVPAWFDAGQRQATKDAAAIAGLRVRRQLNEPTAAALGHGAHRGQNRRFAVCDLGGGTFDVAIVDVEDGVFEVLATAGDSFLGGDDVDRAIVEQLVREMRSKGGIDVGAEAAALVRLRAAAQHAKHDLSESLVADVALPRLAQMPSGKPLDLVRPIRRDELELWSTPILKRLEAPCREALLRAGRAAGEVDEILLVGGMTRMPAVRRALAEIFGKEPQVIPNPDEVVAVGAAVEVARLEGRIEGVLLLDVTARGLSVTVGEDAPCELVIAPSSVIPTREHRVIATRTDNQRELEFDLWEGEAPESSGNRHLARYAVRGLPRAPAGEVLVMVEITIDVDGTARVAASEMISGERPELRQIGGAGLSRSEVARLAEASR
ncbi:MAG TPA: Hsp70 family protein [Kofleriaceae bacterium]|nr:Hsp70 family protein [Kofleriaceae bacterium]